MVTKKKGFKQKNPALAFINASTEIKPAVHEQETRPQSAKAPDGFRANPLYIETKSKRVQLLIQPSVVNRLDSLAKRKGISRNEAFSEAVKAYLEKEGA